MKLKSYLRGLGLGMIVTTIILVIAFNKRNNVMTDAEIMSRAHELGMVETSLYGNGDEDETKSTEPTDNNIETSGEGQIDTGNNVKPTDEDETSAAPENETTAETTPSETTTPEKTTEETTTAKPTEPPTTTAAPTIAPTTAVQPVETTKAPEPETTTASGQYVTIVFEDINTATKASTLLYEAGIIQSIDEFNKYLTERGLATKVGEGTFRFRKGMTFDEIARIITHQN